MGSNRDSDRSGNNLIGKLRVGVIGAFQVAVVLAYLFICYRGLDFVLDRIELPNTLFFEIAQVLCVHLVLFGVPATLVMTYFVHLIDLFPEKLANDLRYGSVGFLGGLIGGWVGFKLGLEFDTAVNELSVALGALLGGFLLPSWSFENPNWLVGILVAIALSATLTDCTGVAIVAWLAVGFSY
jgi:hypothetical protein